MDSADQQKQQRAQSKKTPSLSKRQRRAAGPNPSNTWQQQPRIKSAASRARAYISYAGLADDDGEGKREGVGTAPSTPSPDGVVVGGGKLSSASPPSSLRDSLDPHLDLDSPEVKFGRLLGGTDQRTRHAAVKMLRAYLSSRSDHSNGGVGLSELDLLKLWKGLWYTLYMADKAPVQDKLSKILAEMMWSLAGTEEEDEYAGEYYMQVQEGYYDDLVEEDGEQWGDSCDDEKCNAGECDVNGVFEDADGDTMEIIEMNGSCSDNDDDDDDESEDDEDQTDGSEDEEEVGYEQRLIRAMNEKHCRGAHLVMLYISTFLCTVRREWGNVDKHRVDKFYTAIRYMIHEAYKYMSKRNWNVGIIHLFNDAIYNEGLSAETQGLTNGLRYHLIDICVDELAKVNRDAALPLTEATFLDCLEPFFGLAKMAVDKNVQQRVMQNVLLKFLNEYSFVSAAAAALTEDLVGDQAQKEKAALMFNQVHVGTVSRFIFTIASDSDTDERYRKSLYEMHKAYTRQIRVAGKDVDIDKHDSDDDEEERTSDGKDDLCSLGEELQDLCPDKDALEKEETVGEVEAASHEKKDFDTTDAPSKKKKKRKKKKKAEKDASAVDDKVGSTTPKAAEKMFVDAIAPEEEVQDVSLDEEASEKKETVGKEVAASHEEKDFDTTNTPSEKKKKRKKKKKAEKDASSVDDDTTPKATEKMFVDAITPETKASSKKIEKAEKDASSASDKMCIDAIAPESKSLSKKKMEKHCSKSDCRNDVASGFPVKKMAAKMEDMTIDLSSTPESSKSAKKKRKLQEGVEYATKISHEDFITSHVETPAVNSSKKKTKQNSSPPSVDPRSMHSPDQVVINQNASFEEFGSSDDNDTSSSPSKRVSFGKVNHCKSHKASMKAIKTLDKGRWDTASRTPEKSILRPRIGIVSSVKKGQNKMPSFNQLSSSKKSKKK